MVQHIADVDTVPHPGVLNEHMGDSPISFPSWNRAPAHSCTIPPVMSRSFRIRHLDHQGLIRLLAFQSIFVIRILYSSTFTAHSTTDHGVTGMNLILAATGTGS